VTEETKNKAEKTRRVTQSTFKRLQRLPKKKPSPPKCRAKAVGHRDDGGGGKHPDSLDVDDLVGAILKTLAAFEAEETPVA
jgi:hypothetical protein